MTKVPRFNPQIQGAFILITAAFTYSLFGVFSRLLNTYFDPFFATWIRTAVVVGLLIFWSLKTHAFKTIQKVDYGWFTIVSIIGTLTVVPFYLATIYLPLGTALFLFYAASVCTNYTVAVIFIHEQISSIKFTSLLIALGGTFLIFSDRISVGSIFYMALAALAGACFGSSTAFSKKISSRYTSTQINLVSFIVTTIFYFIVSLLLHEKWNISIFSLEGVWVVVYAVVSVVAGLLTISGFRLIEAQKGSLILLSEVVFGLLIGFIFYAEMPSFIAVVGGVCVVMALALPNVTTNQLKMK